MKKQIIATTLLATMALTVGYASKSDVKVATHEGNMIGSSFTSVSMSIPITVKNSFLKKKLKKYASNGKKYLLFIELYMYMYSGGYFL